MKYAEAQGVENDLGVADPNRCRPRVSPRVTA
jgi:hypothetical protein